MSFIFGKRKTPAELLRENKRMLDKSIREIERERQGLQAQEKKLIVEIKKTAKQGQMAAVKVMAKDLIRTRHQITKFYALKSQLQGVSLRIQTMSDEMKALHPSATLGTWFTFFWKIVLWDTSESSLIVVSLDGIMLDDIADDCLQLATTLKSTQAMGEAMKGVTKAMGQMNKQMNLPALQRIMQEFEMQNEKMEMVSEVMGDAIDDALEGDEEEEETEELVSQVLDEIGIDINSELVKAPSTAVPSAEANKKVAQVEATAASEGGIDDDLQARLDNLRKILALHLPIKAVVSSMAGSIRFCYIIKSGITYLIVEFDEELRS
ncbi:hypothetical protein ZIOFF_033366 [Zingiber officinale]|uniref:Uncharacterized protein n=1 Tax=Zingiber officinale TaxID=94328 RepID=A0A8J5LC70_ZINOF|nr:hypothetical protein ZIOFF_033366 [Zingiber officinale]